MTGWIKVCATVELACSPHTRFHTCVDVFLLKVQGKQRRVEQEVCDMADNCFE